MRPHTAIRREFQSKGLNVDVKDISILPPYAPACVAAQGNPYFSVLDFWESPLIAEREMGRRGDTWN